MPEAGTKEHPIDLLLAQISYQFRVVHLFGLGQVSTRVAAEQPEGLMKYGLCTTRRKHLSIMNAGWYPEM